MRTAYELYQVAFIRHSNREMTIEAVNRKGGVYIARLIRSDDRYWEGCTDFGFSTKKVFKGIVIEFLQALVKEVKDYDKRWYDLHCVVRGIGNGKTRPLTWEETYGGGLINEDEPTFKGGVTFLVERYD